MAIGYGAGTGYIVRASDVNAVYTTGITTTTNTDVDGTYVYQGTLTLGGCGNPNSAVFIQLKDNISWSKMTCYFEMNGSAACWAFNGGGNATTNPTTDFLEVSPPTTGLVPGGNMQRYDEALGDMIFSDSDAFTLTPGLTRKGSACDNDANNFFRFSSTTKSFWMTCRRKDKSNGLAGPFHCRSCNSVGSYILIKNIIIW
jgi:hypothetical protein